MYETSWRRWGKDAYLTTLWVENIKLEAKDRALYSSWLSCFLQAYMLTNLKSLHFFYLYCISMWTTDSAIQVFSLLEFEITDKPKEKARMNHIILKQIYGWTDKWYTHTHTHWILFSHKKRRKPCHLQRRGWTQRALHWMK